MCLNKQRDVFCLFGVTEVLHLLQVYQQAASTDTDDNHTEQQSLSRLNEGGFLFLPSFSIVTDNS